jgi:hypothetical protein
MSYLSIFLISGTSIVGAVRRRIIAAVQCSIEETFWSHAQPQMLWSTMCVWQVARVRCCTNHARPGIEKGIRLIMKLASCIVGSGGGGGCF